MKSGSKTHDRVVNLLYALVDGDKEYEEKEAQSKTNPIHIHFRKDHTEYHPDIWAKTRKKKEIDIYEVWYSEPEREACSDILHAACIENLRYLHIISVRTPRYKHPWDKESARELVRIFSNHLRNKSGEPLLEGKVYYAEIGKEELKDDMKITHSLRDQLCF